MTIGTGILNRSPDYRTRLVLGKGYDFRNIYGQDTAFARPCPLRSIDLRTSKIKAMESANRSSKDIGMSMSRYEQAKAREIARLKRDERIKAIEKKLTTMMLVRTILIKKADR